MSHGRENVTSLYCEEMPGNLYMRMADIPFSSEILNSETKLWASNWKWCQQLTRFGDGSDYVCCIRARFAVPHVACVLSFPNNFQAHALPETGHFACHVNPLPINVLYLITARLSKRVIDLFYK